MRRRGDSDATATTATSTAASTTTAPTTGEETQPEEPAASFDAFVTPSQDRLRLLGRRPSCAATAVYSNELPVLGYAEEWARSGIQCASDETGLECSNGEGHSFFLSRASWRAD